MNPVVRELLDRSNRLGSDRRNTNYAGGNTSAKGIDIDPAEFYAKRTLLKREVLPKHVANAVVALCSEEFSHTTGLLVPVDAGVAAAFLR